MIAREALLNKLISKNIHFSLPIYQRRYEWKSEQWDRLWDNIIEQLNNDDKNKKNPAFLGSIGLKLIGDEGGNVKYEIIDGQQRITTIVLFLAAIRDTYFDNLKIINTVNSLLKLDYDESKRIEHKKKLVLAYQDETCLKSIISELKLPTNANNNVVDCYKHFKAKLEAGYDPTLLIDSILTKFQIVWITIQDCDDAPKIFETLNSAGIGLEQIDHIRIHILTYIDENREREFYFKYWRPIEESFNLNIKLFPEFIRFFLMKGGAIIKSGDLFSTLTKIFKSVPSLEREQFLEYFLSSMLKSAEIYRKISNLNNSNSFSKKINYRLKRLNMIPGRQYYPFLLNLFESYSTTSPEWVEELIVKCLHLIETLYIRRYICEDGEKRIDEVFSDLCKILLLSIDSSTIVSIEEHFKEKIPHDDSVILKLSRKSIYPIGSGRISKLILCSIEEEISEGAVKFSFDPDDVKVTVEHVMPQNPEGSLWEEYLKQKIGPDWRDFHLQYCNTLGNLTLATDEFNKKLARKLFEKKIEKMRKCCGYNLNTYFDNISGWTEPEIKARAKTLTEICIKLWPGGGVILAPPVATGDTLVSLTIKGKEHKIASWLGAYKLTIYLISKHSSDKFRELVNKYPNFFAFEPGKLEKEERIAETSIYFRQVSGPEPVYNQIKIFIAEIGWTSDDWHGIAKDKEKKKKNFS